MQPDWVARWRSGRRPSRSQVGRQRRREVHGLVGDRVLETQFGRMQGLALHATHWAPAVKRIGHKRKPLVRQMHSDLMRASGVQAHLSVMPSTSRRTSVRAALPEATTAMRRRDTGSRPTGASTEACAQGTAPVASAR